MAKIVGATTLDDALRRLGAIAAEAEARGERTLVFCEDRLTLLAERAVLSACGGTFLTEVATFARYLAGPKVLSKEGSVLEISALLSEYAAELKCFRPRAAQAVYETIAQLSASRVDAELLQKSAEGAEGALKGKLSDLALLFEKYGERLKERGLLDENGYLALLPEKLAAEQGRNIVFFGFRSFTKQALEGVRAALGSHRDVTGIFLSGGEELYTNEAAQRFRAVCGEFGGAEEERERDTLTGEAKLLQRALFSPGLRTRTRTDKIFRFTAADESEEFDVIAALIKKHVFEGARYRDIAVLAPESSFLTVEKVFGAYGIPFFADRKRPFSEHPFCTLAADLLTAVSDGVLPDEADAIAASYYFGQADEYRNYLLRYGGYRGGARREIRADAAGDAERLNACRDRMLSFLGLFPRKGKGKDYVEAIRALREKADADRLTERLRRSFTGAEARFLSLDPLEKILGEIGAVAGDRTFTAREFCDGLKGALSALEIAMIPQSADAVFVGELTESKFCRVPIVFASGLTDDVPRVSQDTAVITDGEMATLSEIEVEIEPAIAQVNARARESFGLNLTAFSERLYLSRPLRRGREETRPSEVFACAEGLFDLPPMPDLFPFDRCEPRPALLKLLSLRDGYEAGREDDSRHYSALYAFLGGPDGALGGEKKAKEAGKLIFSREISPSLLETYFACPYAGFARSLRLVERPERPILDTDTGDLIHAVLKESAPRFNGFASEAECRQFARESARALLEARFGALSDTGAGQYICRRLIEEAETVTAAAYLQLARSRFRVAGAEEAVALQELSLTGKTDRIDVSDGFVRVIDYKTGKIDDSPGAYYTGRKLQLELYLRAASAGRTAAGAFYFPAADDLTPAGEPKFLMTGFYCGDDEVVSRMDISLVPGEKSALFKGGYGSGMTRADFEDFLDYSLLVSKRAENEMRAGNIAPSPFGESCKYCKMKSLCGFVGEPRREDRIAGKDVAEIVRRERGEKA